MSDQETDPTDKFKDLQQTARTLDEFKKEVKRLIKENKPRTTPVLWVTVTVAIAVMVFAAKGQMDVQNEIKNLHTEIAQMEKALKTETGEAIRASSADEAKLLTQIENSIKRLEARIK